MGALGPGPAGPLDKTALNRTVKCHVTCSVLRQQWSGSDVAVSDISSFSSTQCHDAVEGALVDSAYHKRLEHDTLRQLPVDSMIDV